MNALTALAAAKAAGVRLTLDGGDGILLETKAAELPEDVVDLIIAAKSDLLRILEWRDAARAALAAKMPADAYEKRWNKALRGLRRFASEGWADRAALLGWTKDELYRLPERWAAIHLVGAAWLIGDHKVVAVTADNIVIETHTGARQKHRHIGREHVA
jgi:hypothetical protein